MTEREEEIDNASVVWFYNEAVCPDLDDAFKAGARYADEHPSEEAVQKVIEAAKNYCVDQNKYGNIDIVTDSFLENFEKEIKERIGIKEE